MPPEQPLRALQPALFQQSEPRREPLVPHPGLEPRLGLEPHLVHLACRVWGPFPDAAVA